MLEWWQMTQSDNQIISLLYHPWNSLQIEYYM